MSDDKQHDETQPVRAEGAPTPARADTPTDTPADAPADTPADTPADAPAAAGTGRRGFRERLRSLRRSDDGNRTFGLAALIASALAGIIVGGLGVATFQAVTDDHDRDRGGWMVRRDTDDEGFGGRGGMHGDPRGLPGQVLPSTPPEDDGTDS